MTTTPTVPLIRRRRTAQEDYFERIDRMAGALTRYSQNVAELISGLNLNGVLWSGTVALGADGTAVLDTKTPFAAVTVHSRGADVTFTTGGQAPSAPAGGPGVFLVRSGITRTWAMTGTQLVMYGTAGGTVEVTLWLRQQPPQHAETHSWNVDATAASPNRVAGAVVSTTLAAANPVRRGLLIFNENPGATTLYVALGPAASVNNVYTVQVAGGSLFELPGPPFYRGIVTGIWTAATGAALVTELQ